MRIFLLLSIFYVPATGDSLIDLHSLEAIDETLEDEVCLLQGHLQLSRSPSMQKLMLPPESSQPSPETEEPVRVHTQVHLSRSVQKAASRSVEENTHTDPGLAPKEHNSRLLLKSAPKDHKAIKAPVLAVGASDTAEPHEEHLQPPFSTDASKAIDLSEHWIAAALREYSRTWTHWHLGVVLVLVLVIYVALPTISSKDWGTYTAVERVPPCNLHPLLRQPVHCTELKTVIDWPFIMDKSTSSCLREYPDQLREQAREGIPAKFRWEVWKASVGYGYSDQEAAQRYNSLAQAKGEWSEQIRGDITRTFPGKKLFNESKQEALYRLLNAYANQNQKIGYCQSMNFIGGLLLLMSDDEVEAYSVFQGLIEKFGLCGFYEEGLPLLTVYTHAFHRLMAKDLPKLNAHFVREGEEVEPAVFLHGWFLTLFIKCLPLPLVPILWDIILCNGLPMILSVAVAILKVLEDSLLQMNLEQIIECFNGLRGEDEQTQTILTAAQIDQILVELQNIEAPPLDIIMNQLDAPCSESSRELA